MSGDMGATVVVVDDEESVAEAYGAMLESEYDVRIAYGGEQALDVIDQSVDVVLLDRRMPGMSGDEVLAELDSRDVDPRVVMTTAVEPTTDILEMPFDEYLCKPVDMQTLHEAVSQQLAAREFDEPVTEFLETSAKIGVLEQKKPPTQLETDERYQQFLDRHDALEGELSTLMDEFEDLATAFRQIKRT